MELRGYLPLTLEGRTLDRETIRRERQVLELPAAAIGDRALPETLWPLFEADPGQAGLVFPDDRCRFTPSALEFVNADYNGVDRELTDRFADALLEAGFRFPVRHVSGIFTILKAFDDGVFLVDAQDGLFHLKRLHNAPVVNRVPLAGGTRPRHIAAAQSERFHGLLLDEQGHLFLMRRGEDYAMIPLPLDGYDPGTMDFKIIFDPLYRTAVYSDDSVIRAVAMNEAYEPIDSFTYKMARGVRTWKHELRDFLFPFSLSLHSPLSRLLEPAIVFGTVLPATLFGLVLLIPYALLRRPRGRGRLASLAVLFAATGIYGVIAASFIEE